MNLLAESKTVIQCSTQTLFDFATNLENFGRWFPGVKSICSGNELAHGAIGKLYFETVSLPVLGKVNMTLKVVECRPNQLFVTESNFPVLYPRMEISFKELGPQSCEIHWKMYTRTGYGIGRLVANPVIKSVMGKRAKIGLSRLGKRIEERLSTGGTSEKSIA